MRLCVLSRALSGRGEVPAAQIPLQVIKFSMLNGVHQTLRYVLMHLYLITHEGSLSVCDGMSWVLSPEEPVSHARLSVMEKNWIPLDTLVSVPER